MLTIAAPSRILAVTPVRDNHMQHAMLQEEKGQIFYLFKAFLNRTMKVVQVDYHGKNSKSDSLD